MARRSPHLRGVPRRPKKATRPSAKPSLASVIPFSSPFVRIVDHAALDATGAAWEFSNERRTWSKLPMPPGAERLVDLWVDMPAVQLIEGGVRLNGEPTLHALDNRGRIFCLLPGRPWAEFPSGRGRGGAD